MKSNLEYATDMTKCIQMCVTKNFIASPPDLRAFLDQITNSSVDSLHMSGSIFQIISFLASDARGGGFAILQTLAIPGEILSPWHICIIAFFAASPGVDSET